jgi:hypothetical protein
MSKKLIQEDLNRFNQIMGYNPSKGLIKEEGEQLSMEFPDTLNPEEQSIIDSLNKALKYVGGNLSHTEDRAELFHNYQYDYLKGDIDDLKKEFVSGRAYEGSKKLSGKQLTIDFPAVEEINTPEDFINLMDSLIDKLQNMGVKDRYAIRLDFINRTFRHRLEGFSTDTESDYYLDDDESYDDSPLFGQSWR